MEKNIRLMANIEVSKDDYLDYSFDKLWPYYFINNSLDSAGTESNRNRIDRLMQQIINLDEDKILKN